MKLYNKTVIRYVISRMSKVSLSVLLSILDVTATSSKNELFVYSESWSSFDRDHLPSFLHMITFEFSSFGVFTHHTHHGSLKKFRMADLR